MNPTVLARLVDWLNATGTAYRKVEHEPTRTSEDSAAARREPLSVGAKALLLNSDIGFLITVIPAHRKLDSSALKRLICSKTLRFASVDELMDLTGLLPGSLPPFGEPLLPFPLYADMTVGEEFGRVAFNAGSRTTSIVMQTSDWLELSKPMLSVLCKLE